jgi:hypothetical protein
MSVLDNDESTDYNSWHALLAARKNGVECDPSLYDMNIAAIGFYRKRFKDKPYVPVVVWRDNETKQICHQINLQYVTAQEVNDGWPHILKAPVTHKEYQFYSENNRWEDADEVVHRQKIGIGHNNPPDDMALLKEQIDSASEGVKAYAEITDDVMRDRAQSLRSRILELKGQAEKSKETEAAPHVKAHKAALAKWKPLIEASESAANKVRTSLSAWETKKRHEEIAKKMAIEKAAEAAKAAGKPVTVVHVPAPTTQIKGAYGRAASAKPVKVVKRITDQDALYAYFKGYPEVPECLMALAKKQLKMYPDSPPPGVDIVEEMEVK